VLALHLEIAGVSAGDRLLREALNVLVGVQIERHS
jgi:hypothetical protein